MVDPVAALTYQLPTAASMGAFPAGRPISAPPKQDPSSRRIRNIVLGALGACAALAAVAIAVIKKPAQ